MEQYLPHLEKLPFWQHISEKEQKALLEVTQEKTYKEEEMVHGAKSPCRGVLLVTSGLLRVYMLSEEGREITLYRVAKDEVCVLSVSCVLKEIAFDVHIDAEEATRVLLIPATHFAALVEKNVWVQNFAYKEATRRFSDVMWTMQRVLFMRLDKRLAGFLLEETRRTGESKLLITQEQIAKQLGTSREVVTRLLRYFTQEKAVALFRGGVEILDANKLSEFWEV